MGKLLDRNREIARRCGDLSPLAGPVRDRLILGNRTVVLAGVSPGSTKLVAPLKPSTLARRKGTGPPRAPMGAASRIVTAYEVQVTAGVGRLSFVAGWPGFSPVIEYLDRGTKNMAARPIFGFRPIDLEFVRDRLREHVIPRGFFGRVAGFFGR